MKKYVLVLLLLVLFMIGCGSDKVIGCSSCVYSRFTDKMGIGDKLEHYEKDYKKINNKVFLGHVVDKDNKILKSYVCGIDSGKVFCLKGNYEKTSYETNKKILNQVYGKIKCLEDSTSDEKYYDCSAGLTVSISNQGFNYIGSSKSNQCYVSVAGISYCYGE